MLERSERARWDARKFVLQALIMEELEQFGVALHVGEIEEAETAMASLKAFGTPLADLIQPMPYVQAQTFFDDAYPEGRRNYWKSSLLETLSDATLDACVDAFRNAGPPYSSILFTQLGGAVARVGEEETAFGSRRPSYDFLVMPAWTEPSESEKHIGWRRSMPGYGDEGALA